MVAGSSSCEKITNRSNAWGPVRITRTFPSKSSLSHGVYSAQMAYVTIHVTVSEGVTRLMPFFAEKGVPNTLDANF